VTAETPHHGRAGHSQGPRVPHEMQVIVDLTLVSFLLVTSTPEQKTSHHGRVGHSQGPRVPHVLQIIVDLALVSAPEQRTSHHGRVGHSQGPRVPHERQRIVDLTLVSFLLVTPAPEQNPHCPNRGGGLAEGLSSVAASSDQKYPRIPWKLCGKFCSEVRTSSCRPLKPCSSGSSRRISLLTFDTWRQVLIRGTLAHLGSSAEIFVQRYGPLLADL